MEPQTILELSNKGDSQLGISVSYRYKILKDFNTSDYFVVGCSYSFNAKLYFLFHLSHYIKTNKQKKKPHQTYFSYKQED